MINWSDMDECCHHPAHNREKWVTAFYTFAFWHRWWWKHEPVK